MAKKSIRLPDILVGIVLILGIPFVIFSHITAMRLEKEGEKELLELKDISASDVERIEIFEGEEKEELANIDSPKTIEQFCFQIGKMECWQPDHPTFTKYFYVILHKKDKTYEFDMCLKDLPERTMFIYGFHTKTNSRKDLYRAKSDTLYDWFVSNDLMKGN